MSTIAELLLLLFTFIIPFYCAGMIDIFNKKTTHYIPYWAAVIIGIAVAIVISQLPDVLRAVIGTAMLFHIYFLSKRQG